MNLMERDKRVLLAVGPIIYMLQTYLNYKDSYSTQIVFRKNALLVESPIFIILQN